MMSKTSLRERRGHELTPSHNHNLRDNLRLVLLAVISLILLALAAVGSISEEFAGPILYQIVSRL